MSRLIEKLRRVYEGPGPSIGFKREGMASYAPMLILALLPKAEIAKQSDLSEGHADALLIPIDTESRELPHTVVHTASDLPWGVWAKELSQETLHQCVERGADFVVFEPDKTSAALTQFNSIGKILKVDTEEKPSFVRAVSQMAIDAALIEIGAKSQSKASVRDLMLCTWVAQATAKPLLVTANLELSEKELRALWEAGVGGVVIRLDGKQSRERLVAWRQYISSLPAKRSRPRESGQALLPRTEMDAAL